MQLVCFLLACLFVHLLRICLLSSRPCCSRECFLSAGSAHLRNKKHCKARNAFPRRRSRVPGKGFNPCALQAYFVEHHPSQMHRWLGRGIAATATTVLLLSCLSEHCDALWTRRGIGSVRCLAPYVPPAVNRFGIRLEDRTKEGIHFIVGSAIGNVARMSAESSVPSEFSLPFDVLRRLRFSAFVCDMESLSQ